LLQRKGGSPITATRRRPQEGGNVHRPLSNLQSKSEIGHSGDLGFDDAWIAKCLDHAASKKSEQIVPSVTGKVYNHSKRMKEKRAVLDGVAAELRRIIGKPEETPRLIFCQRTWFGT
jgi:hypothetical protein